MARVEVTPGFKYEIWGNLVRKEGDCCEGVYFGLAPGPKQQEIPDIWLWRIPENKPVYVRGGSILLKNIMAVKETHGAGIGSYFYITYKGKKTNKSGKQEYNDFSLAWDDEYKMSDEVKEAIKNFKTTEDYAGYKMRLHQEKHLGTNIKIIEDESAI